MHEAYLAGIVDGEGNITVYHTRQGGTSSWIRVANTHLPLLEAIQVSWGGRIYTHSSHSPRGKPSWIWEVTGTKALPVLRGIQPYLIVKKPQADLMLEFLEELSPGSGRLLTGEKKNRREEIVLEFRTLNVRGIILGEKVL